MAPGHPMQRHYPQHYTQLPSAWAHQMQQLYAQPPSSKPQPMQQHYTQHYTPLPPAGAWAQPMHQLYAQPPGTMAQPMQQHFAQLRAPGYGGAVTACASATMFYASPSSGARSSLRSLPTGNTQPPAAVAMTPVLAAAHRNGVDKQHVDSNRATGKHESVPASGQDTDAKRQKTRCTDIEHAKANIVQRIETAMRAYPSMPRPQWLAEMEELERLTRKLKHAIADTGQGSSLE